MNGFTGHQINIIPDHAAGNDVAALTEHTDPLRSGTVRNIIRYHRGRLLSIFINDPDGDQKIPFQVKVMDIIVDLPIANLRDFLRLPVHGRINEHFRFPVNIIDILSVSFHDIRFIHILYLAVSGRMTAGTGSRSGRVFRPGGSDGIDRHIRIRSDGFRSDLFLHQYCLIAEQGIHTCRPFPALVKLPDQIPDLFRILKSIEFSVYQGSIRRCHQHIRDPGTGNHRGHQAGCGSQNPARPFFPPACFPVTFRYFLRDPPGSHAAGTERGILLLRQNFQQSFLRKTVRRLNPILTEFFLNKILILFHGCISRNFLIFDRLLDTFDRTEPAVIP